MCLRPRALCLLGALVAVLGLAACGSNEDQAGGVCDPVAFAMLLTAGSDAKVCPATTQCIAKNCADDAKTCAGPDYESHIYTGLCGAYFDCVKGCSCDEACTERCEPDSMDCASCLTIDLAMGCTLSCMTEIASCGKR